MKDRLELLTDITYLDLGLITPGTIGSVYGHGKDGDHLRGALNVMDPEEARRAKRKFRKLHRKIKKQRVQWAKTPLTRSGFHALNGDKICPPRLAGRKELVGRNMEDVDIRFGAKGKKPEIDQARSRRREVRNHIRNQLRRDDDS